MEGIFFISNQNVHNISQMKYFIQKSPIQQGQKWQLFLLTSGLVFIVIGLLYYNTTIKKCELAFKANSLFDCCNNKERITLNRE
jgi:hypothetical protein